MGTYKVSVYREWTEYGTVEIEAENEEAAREAADEMLTSDDGNIEWRGDNMEPGQQVVDGCEAVA